MADDARTIFVDGLRVTTEHLEHLQDRLRDAILDLRCAVGLGRIAWGPGSSCSPARAVPRRDSRPSSTRRQADVRSRSC